MRSPRRCAGVDSVVHLAAEVGVGQSMYEVERYTSANDVGTAVLFERLIDNPVRRVVTASSMSIYGEGLYRDADGEFVEDAERGTVRDGQKMWDPLDAQGRPLTPVPTPEWKRPSLASIYALNKYVQERTTHIMGAPYGIESVCLRLFNVYGPGPGAFQPLYRRAGDLRLAAAQRPAADDLRGRRAAPRFRPRQRRRPRLRRCAGAARRRRGRRSTSARAGSLGDRGRAARSPRAMGKNDIAPEIVGKARIGDIRHCFCDTALAAEKLGFRARQDFGEGLAELAEWVHRQTAEDRVAEARAELEARGLVA